MHLPGRLSSSTLGDLLGSLHRESITGIIELDEIRGPGGYGVPGRIHRVHLRGGLVVAVDTALPVPPLGEILRREGLCSGDAVQLLSTRIAAGDRRAAGEILQSAGLASAEGVRAALKAQLRQRVDALFAIEEARVGFRTARPLPRAVLPLGPADFLHGRPRARRRNETPRPGPTASHDEPPISTTRPAVDEASERARRLLGIPRGAALGEVRRAFRRLASVLHPDRIASAALEEQQRQAARFAELSAAYHLLVA